MVSEIRAPELAVDECGVGLSHQLLFVASGCTVNLSRASRNE